VRDTTTKAKVSRGLEAAKETTLMDTLIRIFDWWEDTLMRVFCADMGNARSHLLGACVADYGVSVI
jgi:hypothetical protein